MAAGVFTVTLQQYAAPEVIREDIYHESVDIWSLGMTLYLVVFWRYPFKVRRSSRVAWHDALAHADVSRIRAMSACTVGPQEVKRWSSLAYLAVEPGAAGSRTSSFQRDVVFPLHVTISLEYVRVMLQSWTAIARECDVPVMVCLGRPSLAG